MSLTVPKTCVVELPEKVRSLCLVFTDAYDPTQELAFRRIFAHDLVNRGHGICFISHNDIVRIVADTSYPSLMLMQTFSKYPISCIILSRYTGRYWPEILELSQKLSVPSCVFMDDNLLEVPAEIGQAAVDVYNHVSRREALLKTMSEATGVVASTAALEKQLARYEHKTISHTPIYCSVKQDELTHHKNNSDYVKIGYMASRWHAHDLDYISNFVEEILLDYPNVVFNVLGFEWKTQLKQKFNDRIIDHPPVPGNYYAFRHKLSMIEWDIGIAPLRPISYNRCKANTKWIEYTCANIAVVASAFDPYNDLPQSVVALCGHNDWPTAIGEWIKHPTLREEVRDSAREYVVRTFSIAAHAEQFVRMVHDLGGEM
ncbi:hypothetical protein [Methylobacterium nonmethylotrophicum]|uniref:Glycosyltransferase family 1 protein n=1 Tax=Methylobacterium nonmethylotrophicum TaxID=1141884 RepID=A0A4Z0NQY0_9HYPH|nr:hypothetical protein [Methylobacterium nonmethylotrophicum]TGD98935.1 hypothetical protein EU555_13560 [Methylobacterium nonmethylotrophicum]